MLLPKLSYRRVHYLDWELESTNKNQPFFEIDYLVVEYQPFFETDPSRVQYSYLTRREFGVSTILSKLDQSRVQ